MPRMCAAVLVLALGVTAEVPDWLQKKPQIPSIGNMQNKLMQQNQGRRLQAIMSEDCKAACPGVEDMIKAMSERRRLDGHSKLCPHIETMQCTGDNAKVCSDTPDEEPTQEDLDGMDGLKCACACPDMYEEDDKKKCQKKDAMVSCMTGTSSCSKTVKKIGGPRAADIDCALVDAGCRAKGEGLMDCVGSEKMSKWGPCDEAAGKGETMETDCCPILKDIVGCYTQQCIDLLVARNQLMATSESAEGHEEGKKEVKKNIKMGSSCPDSGMPESEADMASKLSSATGGGAAAASDAPAQNLPILALVTALTACIA